MGEGRRAVTACVVACVRGCVRACVRAGVRARARGRGRLRACMRAYPHARPGARTRPALCVYSSPPRSLPNTSPSFSLSGAIRRPCVRSNRPRAPFLTQFSWPPPTFPSVLQVVLEWAWNKGDEVDAGEARAEAMEWGVG
eukprot:6188870-Pleurochrysis_carterae.AAC.5